MKLKLFLLFIVIIGLFFRVGSFRERFYFGHDADLAFWIVKDVVLDNHLRLIGQETSSQGLFIGPLFYYSLVPFYYLTNFDPIGTLGYSWLLGLMSILTCFAVVTKFHGKKAGIIGTFIYTASFGLALTDREVFPTTPIFLWTFWFYYAANQLLAGKKNALYIMAILFSLVWHIQLALGVLTLPTIVIILKNLRKFPVKDLILSSLLFITLLSPFLLFEYRHDYQQIRSLFSSFSKHSPLQRSPVEKVVQVFSYSFKNANFIFWDRPKAVPQLLIPIALSLSLLFLFLKKNVKPQLLVLYLFWFGVFIVFFTLHPINLSEYYLNGMSILWLLIAAQFLALYPRLAVLILVLFFYHNLHLHLSYNGNFIGYTERKAIINYIANDSRAHSYPCIAFSYMTSPGYDLGYRYFIWSEKLKTAPVITNAPVYTIVFPHYRANKLDATFGSLGLVKPDYDRYTKESIAKSCEGYNENETGTMFGFTK